MEWAILYLAKELYPEGHTVRRSEPMTSAEVAQQLRSALEATSLPDSASQDAAAIADEYDSLLLQRNDIVHAHPATINDQQRLHRVRADGTHESIEPDDLVAFSSDCTRLGNRASALLWTLRRGETS
jgi:hypothetical protein